jgi:uncharacterized small protein (DUF1192 family)
MVTDQTTMWGLGGAVIGAAASLITTVLARKPKRVQLEEAANAAVKTALDGYKDYIATMTMAYEKRIQLMTSEHETRIALLSVTYEKRIADLTSEIHSLRAEISELMGVRSKVAAAEPQVL